MKTKRRNAKLGRRKAMKEIEREEQTRERKRDKKKEVGKENECRYR